MQLNSLKPRPSFENNTQFNNIFIKFNKLIAVLSEKSLSNDLIVNINGDLEQLDASEALVKPFTNSIIKLYNNTLKTLEKEYQLVRKNHYRDTWLVLGMSIIGVPLGVAFGGALGNMGFMGLGMPIGLAIGIVVGTRMDVKAASEGRQLDIE